MALYGKLVTFTTYVTQFKGERKPGNSLEIPGFLC